MKKFWQEEVLNFMQNWKQAIKLASTMKKQKHIAAASQKRIHPVTSQLKNPFTFNVDMGSSQLLCSCRNVVESPSNDYSDNFHRRLNASGHRFVDMIEGEMTENDALADDLYDGMLGYNVL